MAGSPSIIIEPRFILPLSKKFLPVISPFATVEDYLYFKATAAKLGPNKVFTYTMSVGFKTTFPLRLLKVDPLLKKLFLLSSYCF